jgi:hypothetical protein
MNPLLNESQAQPLNISDKKILRRRDCAIAGAKTYAAALLIAFSFWTLLIVAITYGHSVKPVNVVKNFAMAAYLVIPPAALLGALTGFELYRISTGSVDWQPSRWWTWILGVILLQWLVIPLYFQEVHRKNVLVEGTGVRWRLPIVYACILIFIGLLQVLETWSFRSAQFMWIQVFAVIFSLLIADCVLVNRMAFWRDEGQLAPPQSHVFQFTLGTMLAIVLSAGTWVSGLVIIFRGG